MNCFPNTWTTFCKFGYFYQFLPVSHQREIFLVVLKQKLFFKCNKISFPMESSYKILIILNCQPLLLKGRVSFVLEFEACHASACPRTMQRCEVPSYSHSITFPYPKWPNSGSVWYRHSKAFDQLHTQTTEDIQRQMWPGRDGKKTKTNVNAKKMWAGLSWQRGFNFLFNKNIFSFPFSSCLWPEEIIFT